LAKYEKLVSNSLTKQLGINSNLTFLPSPHAYVRAAARLSAAHRSVAENVEGHKNNFVSISGFLM
jgi:hypothetical protein